MKILVILIRWKGGVGRVIGSIRPLIESKGHQIEIISREDDLNCYSLKDSFGKLRKEVNKRNYDILYIQDWSCALPLIDKKSFVCFHGEDINKISRFFQTLIGKIKGKKLIVVGDKLKKRFPKSNLVCNGVDLEKFKPLRRKRDCLGWIDKGTEIISKKDIEDIAKKLKLKPLVAKKFSIPFDEMNSEFYNKCQIFVSVPPKSAGFNLCWLEAMAAGVPKIIGNNEGIGCRLPIDKIENFKNIEDAILNVKKKEYRKLLGKQFTWKKHVEELIRLWKKMRSL